MRVISLFSGCGGLDLGFIKAGFEVVWANDFDKEAVQSYKFNIGEHIVHDSVYNIKTENIPDADILIGGFPCLGFTVAKGKDRKLDCDYNQLFQEYARVLEGKQPKYFLVENVTGIKSGKEFSDFFHNSILKSFEIAGVGYKVKYETLISSDYGVPQNRKRVFFIGLLNGKNDFSFPLTTHSEVKITSAQAISDLPEFELENGSIYNTKHQSEYQKLIRYNSEGIYNHQTTKHTESTKKMIALVPDGGNYKSLPKELQEIRKVNIAWTRLNSKKPSFTIDTGHRHHFHYKFNRTPTVREAARIQSFPDSFIFYGSKTAQEKQVGNAVPPLLAEVLAQSIKKYLL